MARGTRRVVDDNNPPDEEDLQEINGKLTEEEKARRAELEKLPMQAELKNLEKRWTKKGRGYITEPKDDDDVPEESINWYEKFALCITREYDSQNKFVLKTRLQVNSPSLKKLLKDVIGTFPGLSFLTANITIDSPYRVLYHYRQEFLDELEKISPDSELGRHLPILLRFLEEEFIDTINETNNLNPQGLCSYDTMWTLFRPGIKIFSRLRGQNRAFKLNSYQYTSSQCGDYLALNVDYIDYDGDDFGTRSQTLSVPRFSGAAPVTALNAFPLARHPKALEISKQLIARGKKWEEINAAGQSFMDYKGIAMKTTFPPGRHNIDCRVMIDTATFHRIEADDTFNVTALPLSDAQKAKATLLQNDPDVLSVTNGDKDLLLVDREPLTDEQRLMATPMTRGFAFTDKLFLDFFVDNLTPIEWNTSCFEQLVLPTSQKELVQALVAEHTQRDNGSGKSFDDIVKNKGLGLILVLHGPPGVGKTLTAECVAEFSKRPLYIVSSGDLGTTSSVLDDKLSRILDLASTWKAVLLIDEADVFLERRSLNDMERNSLVSIFLRTLEYYSGILFMTTNRVRTFDDAFKSRIHVPLKYEELPHSSRVTIWRNFLDKIRSSDPASEGGVVVDVDGAGYERLAEAPLNGRQIKNVVRTAKSLAGYRGGKLDVEALLRVVEIQMAFEEELGKAKGDGMEIDGVEK
ncbi:hypothetical protein PMZ80_005408 [Knufia obscura]|uniref:AAA+ ATPase domain-containing protein n=1 Tax=Knufia obscura TaxID=1635080 RepID=A0ABR0RQD0_9EURO|nr:hypothetical protein PMZ80_005408 [Knufia obscura]